MAVIWGFDLSQMSWGAFNHRNMFNPRWHLRKERFIVYQLAMLISLAAECTATYSLSKYEDHQTHIEKASNFTAHVHNNDLIAAEVLTIVFCVFVATLFGADFFFLLFWPKRSYPRWYNITKKILAVGITAGMLAAAIMSNTVITRHSEFITGVSPQIAQDYVNIYFRPPLEYKKWSVNIAYLVLLWIAWVFTLASTVLMFIATDYDERYGPEAMDADLDERRPANEKTARTNAV